MKEKKIEYFTRNLDNSTFKKYGIGFLLYLLRDHLKNNVFIALTWQAEGIKPITIKFGSNKDMQLVKNIQYVQGVINNRAYNPRLLEN